MPLRSLWFGTPSFPRVTVGSWALVLRLATRLACASCAATVRPETRATARLRLALRTVSRTWLRVPAAIEFDDASALAFGGVSQFWCGTNLDHSVSSVLARSAARIGTSSGQITESCTTVSQFRALLPTSPRVMRSDTPLPRLEWLEGTDELVIQPLLHAVDWGTK